MARRGSPRPLPSGVKVTWQHKYIRCSKPTCACKSNPKERHGPYWYAFWNDPRTGKKQCRYFGARCPPEFEDPARLEPRLALDAIARLALQAAEGLKAIRFGDNKAFISSVYSVIAPKLRGMSLDAFKARLVEAHRQGLLSLSRADLVEAMPAELVEGSEVQHLGSRFQFIRLE